MKRLLAMTLALVLALTLVTPAWAAEELKDISQESPEVQEFLRQMYEEGLLQENTEFDLSYFEDEADEADPVEEYIQAHPDEMAALDYDALLAGWGYKDPKTAFLEDYYFYSDVFEEAVVQYYVDNRVNALWSVDQAEEYKAQYPEAWAAYNEDAYFEKEYGQWGQSKEGMKAEYNFLSDEELTAYLFMEYVDTGLSYDYETGETVWEDPLSGNDWEDPEPTFTLIANGVEVASSKDGTFYAINGVSYADANVLSSVLGVPVSGENNAVRAAAEAAGWDVVWYDGGWRGIDQQVCLWDGETLKAHWAEEFGPAMDFLKDILAYSEATLAQEGGYQVEETITLDLTRFHSLDGDKTVSADIRVKEVYQDGVLDLTLEFNVLDFLNIFEAEELSALAKHSSFDLDTLKTLLKAGKIEFLLDMKTYQMALRAPILTLIAPDTFTDDWMGYQLPGAPVLTEEELDALPTVNSAELLDSLDVPQLLYDSLLTQSEYQGKDANTAELADFCADFFGKDRFTHKGDTWTYTLTTAQVNEAMNDLMRASIQADGVEIPAVNLFKTCDMSYEINTKTGAVDMKLDVRPNAKALTDLSWTERGKDYNSIYGSDTFAWLTLRAVLSAVDYQVTAQAKGDGKTATESMTFHWVNVGELEMNMKAKMGKASAAPRKPKDVAEIPVQVKMYAPEETNGFDLGIIGGEDGPTQITVTPAP